MDLEIESLLFKQVEKPKNHFLTKIHNVWENRYRINIYTETFDNADKLFKRKISASYFCHYNPGKLEIKDENNGSANTKSTF